MYIYIYIYIHNRIEQCALPVTTIMALWQLANLGRRCTIYDVPKTRDRYNIHLKKGYAIKMLHAGMGHMALPCCHKKNIQLSPANPFSNSRSLFLIFANWRLRGVLDPRKHNSAPLSIANDTLVFIHDIVAA